ncbi:TPA: hypothetical protein ACKJ6F_001867 [Neisseria gonorrhoeae]
MSLEKNIANLKNPRVLISAFLRHSFKGGNLETKKTTGIYPKQQNLSAVIPTKAGI